MQTRAQAAALLASTSGSTSRTSISNLDAVLFLDVDGVLHPYDTCQYAHKRFKPVCMQALREVLTATNAALVLSSTWRIEPAWREELDDILRQHNMPTCVSCTPQFPGNNVRSREILDWVQQYTPRTWVAVDDWPLGQDKRLAGHFVQTRSNVGLQKESARRIIEAFQIQRARDEQPDASGDTASADQPAIATRAPPATGSITRGHGAGGAAATPGATSAAPHNPFEMRTLSAVLPVPARR